MRRRDFIKALGGGAAALSFLPLLESQLAASGSAFPTRLVIFFSANGTVPDRWRPEGDEHNWTIKPGDILEPLAPYKDDLIIVEGVDMVSARYGPGDGHQTGMGHMLTGIELMPGDEKGGCETCPAAGFAGGPSVDQYIAQQVFDGEAFRSMEFGVQSGGPNTWSRMCSAGPGQPVEPQQNPHNAFDRLFGSLGQSEARREQLRQRRASVLDFVHQDMKSVQRKVSGNDAKRIDQHLSEIRDLEARLRTGDGQGISCTVPDRGEAFDPYNRDNYPAAGQAMMDMIVSSFACGLTRVASLQWDRSVSNILLPWSGAITRHHDLSHRGDEDVDAESELVKINRWYAQQFAYLVGRLKSVPEGDGTLLDHTVVVWCNELGKGNSHTRNNVPYVMAGGANGFFKTGRYLRYDNDPHNNFLVSLCQSMGVQTDTFGNPSYCTGPLQGLRGV